MKTGIAIGFAIAAALLQAHSPARAAPHEIQVFADEIEDTGEIGTELHVNYARGRSVPAYPGELPPDRVWRVMPEIVFGVRKDWEIGLHLPAQIDADGKFHADGLRVRLKHAQPLREAGGFFAGFNVEYGYDRPHLSEDRHNLELRGILGWRNEDWLVAVNPILAWVLKGPNKSSKPDLDGSFKVARTVGEGWAVGIEHYAGYGPLEDWLPRRQQDRMLYFAVDYEGKGWSVNFGIGAGLTPASDDKVIKTIVSIPFK